MATCSSILPGKIPWIEELGGPQSMVSQSRTRLSMHTHTHTLESPPQPGNTGLVEPKHSFLTYF